MRKHHNKQIDWVSGDNLTKEYLKHKPDLLLIKVDFDSMSEILAFLEKHVTTLSDTAVCFFVMVKDIARAQTAGYYWHRIRDVQDLLGEGVTAGILTNFKGRPNLVLPTYAMTSNDVATDVDLARRLTAQVSHYKRKPVCVWEIGSNGVLAIGAASEGRAWSTLAIHNGKPDDLTVAVSTAEGVDVKVIGQVAS